jgi:hypothetical protein
VTAVLVVSSDVAPDEAVDVFSRRGTPIPLSRRFAMTNLTSRTCSASKSFTWTHNSTGHDVIKAERVKDVPAVPRDLEASDAACSGAESGGVLPHASVTATCEVMKEPDWFEEWVSRSRAEAKEAARREPSRTKRWFPQSGESTDDVKVWTWRARLNFLLVALALTPVALLLTRAGLADAGIAGGIVVTVLWLLILGLVVGAASGQTRRDRDAFD